MRFAAVLLVLALCALASAQQTLNLIENDQFQALVSVSSTPSSSSSSPSSSGLVGDILVFGVNPLINASSIMANLTSGQTINLSSISEEQLSSAPSVATIAGFCVRLVATSGQANVSSQSSNQTALLSQFPVGNTSATGLWMCQQTYAFSQLDTLQAAGLFIDNRNSILSIVGGTGSFVGANGWVQMSSNSTSSSSSNQRPAIILHQVHVTSVSSSA